MIFIFELLAWPLGGILQAIVGVLWPSDDPAIHRLQRKCGAALAAGLLLGAFTALLAWLAPTPLLVVPLLLSLLCIAVSATWGHEVERLGNLRNSN